MNSTSLAILGCLYPQRHVRAKVVGAQIVALISLRAIHAVDVYLALVYRRCVRTVPVSPAGRELNVDLAKPIHRSVLHLHPSKFTIFVCHQVEWTMLGERHEDRKSLLEQVNLSLQDAQVTLYVGCPQVSTGLPSALPVKVSPLQCGPLGRFRFPTQAPHSKADALSG